MAKNVSNKTIDNVTIRFAGDSGDGMQLSGGRFTQTSAVVGNDLSTPVSYTHLTLPTNREV